MVLLVGWFSFEGMGATAGDLMARDVACRWLRDAGASFDVALAAPFDGGVKWEEVDPTQYSHVVFVCGPVHDFGEPFSTLLSRFDTAEIVGLDVSMVAPVDEWDPFDVLIERDSSRAVRPDLALLAETAPVPVVGVIRSHGQREYGERRRHRLADEAIDRLLAHREAAIVAIDTRLDRNRTGLRTPGEIESLISAVDVVVTTRLHGMVLAIKNDVPALAIDPISGGAKVVAQATALAWPAVAIADELKNHQLAELFDWCLSPQALTAVAKSKQRGLRALREVKDDFLAVVLPGRSGGAA